jgi:hypothetical protein
MRWFRISSVPVRDRRAGWYHHPPGRWLWIRLAAGSEQILRRCERQWRQQCPNPASSASPCGWHRPAETQSTAPASDTGKPLVCPISLSVCTLRLSGRRCALSPSTSSGRRLSKRQMHAVRQAQGAENDSSGRRERQLRAGRATAQGAESDSSGRRERQLRAQRATGSERRERQLREHRRVNSFRGIAESAGCGSGPRLRPQGRLPARPGRRHRRLVGRSPGQG